MSIQQIKLLSNCKMSFSKKRKISGESPGELRMMFQNCLGLGYHQVNHRDENFIVPKRNQSTRSLFSEINIFLSGESELNVFILLPKSFSG